MFGGFERQSVLNYIYETFNATQEAQDRLTAQIEEMSATRERLEQSVKDLENRLSENDTARNQMGEELSTVKVKNTELTEMLNSLNEEIDRQKLIVKEKDEQINRITHERAELEQRNAQLEMQASELMKGQNDIEKSKAQIGDLVVKSHLEAERILEQANERAGEVATEAGELVARSRLEGERILEQASERAGEVAAEADQMMAKTRLDAEQILEQANERAMQAIAEANVKAEQITQAASRSSGEVAAHLSSFRDEIDRLKELMEEAFEVMRDKFTAIGQVLDKSESQVKSSGPRPSGGHIVLAPQIASETPEQEPQASEFF